MELKVYSSESGCAVNQFISLQSFNCSASHGGGAELDAWHLANCCSWRGWTLIHWTLSQLCVIPQPLQQHCSIGVNNNSQINPLLIVTWHRMGNGHMTCYDVNSEFIALPHVTLAGLLAATLTRYSRHLARGQWLFSTFPNYNHPYTFGAPRLVCAQCTISSNFNCCRTSHRRLE